MSRDSPHGQGEGGHHREREEHGQRHKSAQPSKSEGSDQCRVQDQAGVTRSHRSKNSIMKDLLGQSKEHVLDLVDKAGY